MNVKPEPKKKKHLGLPGVISIGKKESFNLNSYGMGKKRVILYLKIYSKQARRTAMDRSKRLQTNEESIFYLRFSQVLTPAIQRSIAAQRP